MKDTIECYKVLEVEPGASPERIRNSYVALVRTWDPDRYVGNPLLHEEALKKRAEIEEAYQAIRFFLPALYNLAEDRHPDPEQIHRDFKELERQKLAEKSRAFMGILAAVTLVAVFFWAFYVLVKGTMVEKRLVASEPAPTVAAE